MAQPCSSLTGEFLDWLLKALTAVGTIGATIVAVVIALRQDQWRNAKYHPTLELKALTEPPDCIKIPYVNQGVQPGPQGMQLFRLETTSYYLRVLVLNTGTETARNVELYAKELRQELKDGRWEIVDDFPPMNLTWSDSSPERAGVLAFLPADSSRHCDIAHVLDPKDRKNVLYEDRADLKLEEGEVSLTFDLVRKPLHLGYIVRHGHYRLSIEVAADNFKAVTKEVYINFDGKWDSDQQRMFTEHIGIIADPEK
jgi:hypothetical protein